MTVYRDKMNSIDFEVSDYVFESLTFSTATSDDSNPESYTFKEIGKGKLSIERHEALIKKERVAAKKNNFTIAPIVLEHRGLQKQEETEREAMINDEVERRLELLKAEAIQEGLEKGIAQGREEIFQQTKHDVEAKLELVSEMTNTILSHQNEILEAYKKEIYGIVKNLSKWVILRELKEDGSYLERLLEKLVLDINTKANLLIKVGPENAQKMDHVFDIVQGKVGQFQNVRLVIDDSLDSFGLVVESDNGILNAEFKEQMIALDQLFESLGVMPEEQKE
jgi:flagellar assembly protein FliH